MKNEAYEKYIGRRVKKKSKSGNQPKPFKSGLKVNTVKGVITHPILNIPAFIFEEDDSYVSCSGCILAMQ